MTPKQNTSFFLNAAYQQNKTADIMIWWAFSNYNSFIHYLLYFIIIF